MNTSETRKALKALGYGLSLSSQMSPFSDKVVVFKSLVLPNKVKVMLTSSSVFGEDFYKTHKAAIELVNGLTL